MDIAFDTLQFARSLQNAGLPQTQAEAIAEASSNAFGQMMQARDLATKKDLLGLEMSLHAEMAQMKSDLIKWVIGVGFGLFFSQAALFFTALAWLRPLP